MHTCISVTHIGLYDIVLTYGSSAHTLHRFVTGSGILYMFNTGISTAVCWRLCIPVTRTHTQHYPKNSAMHSDGHTCITPSTLPLHHTKHPDPTPYSTYLSISHTENANSATWMFPSHNLCHLVNNSRSHIIFPGTTLKHISMQLDHRDLNSTVVAHMYPVPHLSHLTTKPPPPPTS